MKKLILLPLLVFMFLPGKSNYKDTLENSRVSAEEMAALTAWFQKMDSVEKSMNYVTGSIKLENGVASLNIPQGFKFINARQSKYILEDLWENTPDNSVLGMIVSDSFCVNSLEGHWAFIVTYDAIGYVKDHDADKIDYDELLKDIKKSQQEANKERKKLGYASFEILGWASKPFYDKENKVLHWAKEFSVAGTEEHSLNYDVRVLGRKGVLSLNAVSTMDKLEEVKKTIPFVLKMANFETGYKYNEFNSGVDEVAAWTIGGLVAGKVLAKAGFFALLLKFWKIIIIAIAAGGGAVWRFITGKKKEETYSVE